MAYNPSYPSGTNTFIPTMNSEATAGLVVNFSRNPKDFPLPRWASYTPVKRHKGFFLRMNIDQCARVIDPKGNNNIWPRGADAPELTYNLEAFGWMPFSTERYLYGFQLADDAERQGDFSPMTQNNAVEAQRAMTQRTVKAINVALTSGNYDSSHVATATVWGGGYLNAGTSTDPIFARALLAAYRRIHRDSRGTIKPGDCVVVLSPPAASVISLSAEIRDYMKGSPYALEQLRGDSPNQNGVWGLPPVYAGFKIVVEDTVYNPHLKGETLQTGEYAFPWHTVGMFARPGGLIAPEGSMSFSTVHVFLKEDMSVEQFDDRINRRMTSRFVDDFSTEVVAPVSGVLITSALASEPVAAFPTQPNQPFGGRGVPASYEEIQSQINQLSNLLDQLRDQKNPDVLAAQPTPQPATPATPAGSPDVASGDQKGLSRHAGRQKKEDDK